MEGKGEFTTAIRDLKHKLMPTHFKDVPGVILPEYSVLHWPSPTQVGASLIGPVISQRFCTGGEG